jgi:hypothetical protein
VSEARLDAVSHSADAWSALSARIGSVTTASGGCERQLDISMAEKEYSQWPGSNGGVCAMETGQRG